MQDRELQMQDGGLQYIFNANRGARLRFVGGKWDSGNTVNSTFDQNPYVRTHVCDICMKILMLERTRNSRHKNTNSIGFKYI